MVLQGSLHGYSLSDIFNLLILQKASGNLELSSEGKEGRILFKEGMIAGAIDNEERLSEKLFFLVADTCHYPLTESTRLFAAFPDDMTGLCDEIVRRNLLSRQALRSFAVSVIEDIVCRFFLWRSGTYHFSAEASRDRAGEFPVWLRLSPEKVSMEAFHRFDEWRRIRLRIDPDAVYAPIGSTPDTQAANLHLHLSTAELVLSRIDGVSPVSSIIRTSCLTTYKTYEAITVLLAEKRIRPIKRRSYHPRIRGHPGRERRNRKATISGRTLAALFLVAGIVIVTVFVGRFVVHGTVLSDLEYQAAEARLELPAAEAIQKIEYTSFLYDASYGVTPALTDLGNAGLLTVADLRPLFELQALGGPSHRTPVLP